MGAHLIAVDVGTGSARAGVVDPAGAIVGRGEAPIRLDRPDALRAHHDSSDIWTAVGMAVREAVSLAALPPDAMAGLAFDATCSLVLRRKDGAPLVIDSASGADTISWMDHRAIAEAEELSRPGAAETHHVGGRFSPEMQMPKLLWLRRNRPDLWQALGSALDLSDWLTLKATGTGRRSLSVMRTKWAATGKAKGPSPDFLLGAGLDDLIARADLSAASEAGSLAGTLSAEAARHLGLPEGLPVAHGMVDAYAGASALLVRESPAPGVAALIAGTSNCLIVETDDPLSIPCFWGPFADAMTPGRWAIEGGQSAAGAALDFILSLGGDTGRASHDAMAREVMAALEADPDLARDLHVLPDFHGNRSPIADPSALGVIHGLALDQTAGRQRALYWRTMVSLALGIRQIAGLFGEAGHPVGQVRLGGGHSRSLILPQLYADALGVPVDVAYGDEAMLVGTAMLAATAAGLHPDLPAAGEAMKREPVLVTPDPVRGRRLDRDYRIFLAMQSHRDEIRRLASDG